MRDTALRLPSWTALLSPFELFLSRSSLVLRIGCGPSPMFELNAGRIWGWLSTLLLYIWASCALASVVSSNLRLHESAGIAAGGAVSQLDFSVVDVCGSETSLYTSGPSRISSPMAAFLVRGTLALRRACSDSGLTSGGLKNMQLLNFGLNGMSKSYDACHSVPGVCRRNSRREQALTIQSTSNTWRPMHFLQAYPKQRCHSHCRDPPPEGRKSWEFVRDGRAFSKFGDDLRSRTRLTFPAMAEAVLQSLFHRVQYLWADFQPLLK